MDKQADHKIENRLRFRYNQNRRNGTGTVGMPKPAMYRQRQEDRFMGDKRYEFQNVSQQRSKNMSRIRGKDTSIEVALRRALWKKGYRYRRNYKALPGSPDICLTKYKLAIFCDSEFFHGKDWEVLRPRVEKGNNGEYWAKKIQNNINRDNETDKKLLFLGWTVIHFWGADILKKTEECVRTIEEVIFDIQLNDMGD